MKLVVLTHIVHKESEGKYYSYEPYVREMNLWFNPNNNVYVDKVRVVGAFSVDKISPIDSAYSHNDIGLVKIPSIDMINVYNTVKAFIRMPFICMQIFKTMRWADHIHLRCPSNIGLLASFVQILFPKKPKTVKYAGNWDPNSRQPWSYRLQKWLLSNTFLSRNIKVLVYGEWENQSKNIIPFFTASYSEKEILPIAPKSLGKEIKLIYVGGLTPGKQPLIALEAVHAILKQGLKVKLDIYGDGIERSKLEAYIKSNQLRQHVILHGNVSKDIVKLAFQKSHFLIFLSKSEGWPKVVAEAMFWGCVPITTAVSCVPYMLGNGGRGALVNSEINTIVLELTNYIKNSLLFQTTSKNAMEWSRTYTLEYFRTQISKLLKN